MKLRAITSRRQANPYLGFMTGSVIILRKPLTNFIGRRANNWMLIDIVVGIHVENLYADQAFLQAIEVTL